MVRVFKLRNANGEELNLTRLGELVLFDVEGLGYETNPVTQRVGNHFAILADDFEQGEISGYVKFWLPQAYKAFFNFAQFCQIKPLTLVYENDAGVFLRDGIMKHVGKAESNGSALTSDITFLATTPYYRVVKEISESSAIGGKVYNYTYPYTYAGSATQSVIIESDAEMESPTKIEIYGPVENPTWRHYLNNVLKATGTVNAVIEEGRKLVIDTSSIPYRIVQTDMLGNLVSDLYQFSDFETERFIWVGKGKNAISVTQTAVGNVLMAVEARLEYAAV